MNRKQIDAALVCRYIGHARFIFWHQGAAKLLLSSVFSLLLPLPAQLPLDTCCLAHIKQALPPPSPVSPLQVLKTDHAENSDRSDIVPCRTTKLS